MTTTIKATSAAGFLGLVPSLLGFTPSESLVAVPFAGIRTVGAMRIDLPAEHIAITEFASTLSGLILRINEADGVALVVYTSRPHDEQALAVLNTLLVQFNDHGMRVVDALYVAGDGWGSLLGGGALRPLEEIEAHPDAPTASAGDQTMSATLPEVDEEYRLAVTQVPRPPAGLDEAPSLLDLIEIATTPGALPATEAADLGWLLARPALRDIALIQWCRGMGAGLEALAAQLAWEDGVEYPAELAMTMWGEGSRPDADRLKQVHVHLRMLAAIIPDAGIFATLGWISWALGRSSEAEIFAKQGLALDTEHGLCEIVSSFVHAGHLPAWAFDRA